MLSSIRVHDDRNNFKIELPLSDRKADPRVPYAIKEIQGLGPVEAAISTSSYSGLDGGILQATKINMRNIVIKIGYNPNYRANQTTQSLRQELYSYFPPKREVVLNFHDEGLPNSRITGIVESHEPVIFSKEPEVVISILCLDPYFKSPTVREISGFNNAAVYPLLKTGETGFKITVLVNRSISSLTIESAPNTPITYDGSMVDGDVLTISTVRGNKYARLLRNGVSENVLDGITGSMGMTISPSTDDLYVRASGAANIPFILSFTPTFIGI